MLDFVCFPYFNNMYMYNINSICVIISTAYVMQKCIDSLFVVVVVVQNSSSE